MPSRKELLGDPWSRAVWARAIGRLLAGESLELVELEAAVAAALAYIERKEQL